MIQKNILSSLFVSIVTLVTSMICCTAQAYNLPDSGQTQCFSTKGKIKIAPCPPPGDPNAQDGSYAINLLSYTINSDGTALDLNTNLMWQREDDDITRTWGEADNYCSGLNLGGYADWRLPSKRELSGIVNYGQVYPAITRTAFPDTKSSYYWTSTKMTCYFGEPWAVDFASGNVTHFSELTRAYARCVRGGLLPFAHFTDNGNGTVSDLSTGLTWQQNEKSPTAWADALSYCEGLSFGGYTDWRAPNIKEYESLTNGAEGPSVITDYLNLNTNFPTWSSTTYLPVTDYSYKWAMNSDGYLIPSSTKDKISNKYGVRCVRGKPTASLDQQEIRVSPTELDFWRMNANGVTVQNVVISNAGKGSLSIGTISIPSSQFSLTSDTCSGKILTALASCVITITFDSPGAGNFTGSISVPSSDADRPVVDIALQASSMDTFYLSDTAQETCYTENGTLIGCPLPGSSLGQDGSYTMNPPSCIPYSDGTVRDANTSLVWQQQDDGVIRTFDEAARYCENIGLAGYADWRLPTVRELIGIADYGRSNPAIDSSGFPSTKNSPYWSSTVSDTYKDNAWFVNFSDGSFDKGAKSASYYVRCVRGPQIPVNTLVDNADGTTTDLLTGLMWQQQNTTTSKWESALANCENLELAGYADWRLPNIRELTSIVDIRYKPAMNPSFFPQVDCGYWSEYWTSTSYLALQDYGGPYVPEDAYIVDFFNARSDGVFEHKYYSNYNVRCVRGGTVKLPSALRGIISDSSTGLPIADALVTVADTADMHTTSTDSNGFYRVDGLSFGSFTATFGKPGYTEQIVNGTLPDGQTVTLDILLTQVPPPSISIIFPTNSAVVNSSPVEVRGIVSSDATVTVNEIPASVDNGSFSALVTVQKGFNTVTAVATDSYGRTASDGIAVNLITQGIINGLVTESVSLSPVQAATLSVTDSLNFTHTSLTGLDGKFIMEGIEAGLFRGTVTKEGFIPFAFSGTLASGETRTINAPLSKIFSAITIGDYGNVTVMEITGNYDAKKTDGSLNTLPRQEVAKEFFRLHPDEYDFLIVLSNFDYAMPDPDTKGFYLGVKNETQGIGTSVFDKTSFFGSTGKLQGIIDMGNVVTLITDPRDPNFEDTINTLTHEQMHRWGAYVKYKDAYGSLKTDLLGKDESHWSFLLDSGASLHYGNAWRDNFNGTFTSTGGGKYCSPLDLYLMGFIEKSKVPHMLLIGNPAIASSGLPDPGITISGLQQYVTIGDIIAAEGERIPNASSSQKSFKAGFILITAPGSFAGKELQGIENMRNAWAGRFSSLTGGKGSIAGVVPSLTIVIGSPVQGEMLSNQVTVKGAFINTAGIDTGVTVNGIPATVYGNQFVVNNVPLVEGINTITATATDLAGNTATNSVTVSAKPDEQYIRLQSNMEAGIAPLDLILRMDASFSFDDAEITVTGPSQPDILNSGDDNYRFAITVEGIYSFTASVTAPDGNVYRDTITITVLNPAQMDNLLRRKWEGMKNALATLDFNTAVAYFTEETRPHYHDIFTALDTHIPQIVQDMQNIERIYIVGNSAKYRIRKDELYGGQAVPITHYIYFAVDNDGLWKIDWY